MGIRTTVVETTLHYCDTCGKTVQSLLASRYMVQAGDTSYLLHFCNSECYDEWVAEHKLGMKAPTPSSEPPAPAAYGPNEFRTEASNYYVLSADGNWMRGAFRTLQDAKDNAKLGSTIYKHSTVSEQRKVVDSCYV